MKVLLIAVALIAVSSAQNYAGQGEQYRAGSLPSAGAAPYPQPVYNYAPRPYSFGYDIKDPQSYNDYGHHESSDGKTVTGSYRVALPDGRLQLVNYRADDYGYVADVQYQGEAKFPEYRPQQYAAPAGPAYPAPVGPGPLAASVPIRVPSQGYAGQGAVHGGFAPINAGAGTQKY